MLSQATCERGFAAMEESHQKVIDELQKKHQRELENLQEEKERLLAEETAATIAGKLDMLICNSLPIPSACFLIFEELIFTFEALVLALTRQQRR